MMIIIAQQREVRLPSDRSTGNHIYQSNERLNLKCVVVNLFIFFQSKPELLSLALSSADPDLLRTALTNADPELLKVNLKMSGQGVTL